jgi:hypothetical protein
MSDDACLTEDEWALLDDVADDWYGLWEVDWWFNGVHPDWPFESRLAYLSDLVRRKLIDVFFGRLGKERPALDVNDAVEAISLPEAWLPRADISEAVYHVSTSELGRLMLARSREPSETRPLTTHVANDWSLSNPGPNELVVWLEPWAEEFVVPARSTIAVRASGGAEPSEVGEIEWVSDHVVIWATAKIVEVYIDDVLQDTASAIVQLPDGLSRGMLNVMFKGQPAARLGGAASYTVDQPSWWARLRLRLGLN